MIYEELAAVAARSQVNAGLRCQGRFHPYVELLEEVDRLAAAFLARGVAPGEAVAILLQNAPDLFVVAHALFAIGAVAMPLGLTGTAAEHAPAIGRANAVALIAGPAHADLAAQVAAELGRALPIWVRGEGGELAADELHRQAPATLPKVSPDAPALYMMSSGSTGMPKIVPHTQAELLADATRTSTAWGLTPDDIVFDMLPPNFAMGFLMGATNALMAGATTVYWSDPRPLVLARSALLEAISGERVTTIGAVPAMFETMLGARGDFDLRAIRLAFSGGAALKRETYDGFRDRFGIRLRQSYGSTEAIMVAHNNRDDVDGLWNSVGPPAGDARVRIDQVDTPLGQDVGELLIASSSVGSGYLDASEATAASFENGWLRSGDLARLDSDGNIFIVGRSKLLIEVSGFKIDPIEVEAVLAAHEAVAEAAVVGVSDRGSKGQRLKAVVVRSDDVSPDTLIRHMRGRLSAQKVPTLIEFRDALPKSEAGKVLRARLTDDA